MENQNPPSELLQSFVDLFNQGRLQEALSESTKLLKKFPNSVVLFNIAGASNAGLKQFDAAIHNYKQALKIKPDYAEAYFNMANVFKVKGDLEEAIENYKQALKLKPNYADAYNNMGNALKDKGDPEAAIESYKQALKFRPNNANTYNNMGSALKDKGDLEEAINSYKEAIKIKPNYTRAKSNLVKLLTTFTTKNESSNLIVKVNEQIRKIVIKENTSKIISDNQAIALFLKSESYISMFGLNLRTELTQVFRRSSVDLNCTRHKSIFDKHNIIPEFCFGCYKVQVEPRSLIELIKLFIVFDQLELDENNTRKCMIEVRPEVSGFYKGLIFCSGLKQANQISKHLDIVINQSISSGLTSQVKRGCSEYPISYPNYKEINNSGPQLMNYKEEWKVIEVTHDKEKPIYPKAWKRPSLSGLSLSDTLIIRKWIDYAKGIGDSTADLLSQDTLHYQDIYNIAKARLDKFNY